MEIINKILPYHCYPGRKLRSLEMLIIHYFSGRWEFPEDRFNMQKCWDLFVDLNLPVEKRLNYKMGRSPDVIYGSAALMIGRAGEVWRLVPEGYEAWHAGTSSWVINGENRTRLNYYSDGIEFINDGIKDYEDIQYKVGARVYKEYYSHIPLELVRGHDEISPGRKKDPGKKFDWDYFKILCSQ